jgi:c-di-GMP-binding flagellar brake protein YcgR
MLELEHSTMSEESHNSDVPDRSERRRHPRCKVGVQVQLHPEGAPVPFRTATQEISLGGCYIETMFTMAIGTKIAMTLWLDDAEMTVTGIVATCYPQVGNGIEFADISVEDGKKLEQYLAKHAEE